MQTLLKITKAFIGLILIFVFHIPRIIWQLLMLSYAAVFNNHENLTANPQEHLSRALRLLKKDNSHLIYAALEIRLAIEYITDRELSFARIVNIGMLKKNDPVKKTNYLYVLSEAAKHPHRILLKDTMTGGTLEIGKYIPLNQQRVREIEGKTGNLLHMKYGIAYGDTNDPWYKETRAFLTDAVKYLRQHNELSTPFFTYEGCDNIVMEKINSSTGDYSVRK